MSGQEPIKCVVWDLDGTIWDGVLLESDKVVLRSEIKGIIQQLDSRGILHSIASKNNYDDAMKQLKEFGLDEYFLYPEINWNAKSYSIAQIQKNFNIQMDSILFIDDQPFECDEVQSEHPEVMCLNANKLDDLLIHPRLKPKFVTEDSTRRRKMYLQQIKRKNEEDQFKGPKNEFLKSLKLQLIISRAKEEDLQRAEELTVRTNQLNATGITYSYEQLKMYLASANHELVVCEVNDKYGSYGKIGLLLIEIMEDFFHIRLFLMSCRVISLGVGTILLQYIMDKAKNSGKKLKADFRRTRRNRMMYITFKLANFTEVKTNSEGFILFENDLSIIQNYPPHIDIVIH